MSPTIDITTDMHTNQLVYRLTMPISASIAVDPRTVNEEQIHRQLAYHVAGRLSARGLKDTIVALCYSNTPGYELAQAVSAIFDRAYTQAYSDAMTSASSSGPTSQPTATLRF